jgi:hypothetical protein
VEQGSVDLAALRLALRQMPRGNILMIAERAIELLPEEALAILLRDFVQVPRLDAGKARAPSLLDQVRTFHDASLSGNYYESYAVNSKNDMDHSSGTDAFIAEFDRLIGMCLRAAAECAHTTAVDAFELLFAVLRRIDEDADSVVFFADEAGSWQIPVEWETVLPSYFQCLADGTSAENFASKVDGVIADHCRHRQPQLLAAAQRVANAEQQAALQRLPTRKGRS